MTFAALLLAGLLPTIVGAGWRGVSAQETSDRLHRALRDAGVDMLELSTGEPYDGPLVRFFRDRARRASRSGG